VKKHVIPGFLRYEFTENGTYVTIIILKNYDKIKWKTKEETCVGLFIPYLLLALSILLETAKNVFSNNFSKRMLRNETDIYKFNCFMYIGSFLMLCLFGKSATSPFTVLTAFLFAVAVWLNQYFFLKALHVGSMSFTTFIQGSGLLVPLIYGAFVWNEPLSLRHILLLAVLIVGMALSLNLKREKTSLSWILFSFGAMLFLGLIGILQATHQMSVHKDELISFLRLTFLFTAVINLAGWRIGEKKAPSNFTLKSSAIPMAAASGAFMGLVHVINLYLAGVLPKVIFFPVSNGGLIFVTLISDLIFFKEKLNTRQWLGIIIGTVALSLMG